MIIVNFATGHYLKGQQRLKNSLNGYKTLMFQRYDQLPGCPTHQESPYAFKIYAIEKAFELDDIVLWADASMWRVGDISKVERIIIEDGYFMEEAGHYTGRWLNEHNLNYFKPTPEEIKQEPGGSTMFSAGFLGLNKNNLKAMAFFEHWKDAEKAGCFRGSWNDSRHDMSAGSLIATRLGMKYQRGGSHLSYIGPGYSAPEPGSVFHLQGI